MAQQVDEIIAQAAIDQLQQVIGKLQDATNAVTNLATASKNITLEIKGVNDLQNLQSTLDRATAQTSSMAQATQNLSTASANLSQSFTALGQSAKDNAERLALQKLELGYVQEQLKVVNKEIVEGKGNMDQNNALLAQWTQRQQELKVEISATTIALKAQIKENQAVNGSMAEMSQTLGLLRSNYRSLTEAERNSPFGTKMLADIKALDAQLKELDKSIGNNQRNIGNYPTVGAELAAVRAQMQLLVVAGKEGEAEYEALRIRATELAAAQRTVTAETGRNALSFEAIGRRIETSFIRMFLHVAVIGVIVEALRSLGDAFTTTMNRMNAAEIANEAVAKDLTNAYQTEAIQVAVLKERFDAAGASMSEKKQIAEELNSIIKDQYGAITSVSSAEKFFVDKSSAFINALQLRAEAQANLNQLTKEYEKEAEVLANPKSTLSNWNYAYAYVATIGKSIKSLIPGVGSGPKKVMDVFGDIVDEGSINTADAALNESYNKRDIYLKNLLRLQKEAAAIDAENGFHTNDRDKDKKAKQVKDDQFKAESDYANSVYQLDRQRLEADRDTQKSISDNVKNDLEVRLSAYQQYQADLLQLAALERDKEISIHGAKEAEIERQMTTATGNKLKSLKVELQAQENFIEASIEKFDTVQNAILIKGGKDRKEIFKSNNAEWITEQKDSFADQKLDQAVAYRTEVELLEKSYADKKISRDKYEEQFKELKKQEQIIELESEIELDRRILDNKKLTTEERLQYEKDLAGKIEALANARAGLTEPKRNDKTNFTDPLAKLLGGDEFDKSPYAKQQQYLKDFYDASVNLAKTAADAIIQINNNRFAQEQLDLEHKAESVRTNAQQEADVINATADNDIQRKNELSKLAAQTKSQEDAINAEKRRVAIEQARFQRTANIAGIIGNTAQAVTKTLAELGPLGIPVAALIAAAGAIQLSVAANAPIPQYRHGTTNHKGGAFIAGDGGEKELITPPDKAPYWSNSISTLYNEKAGTTVTPLSKLTRNVDISSGYKAGSITALQATMQPVVDEAKLASLIGDELMKHGENLSYVIMAARNKPQKQESIKQSLWELKNTQGL